MKVFDDLVSYAEKAGQIFEKQLYSNITEVRLIWVRPSHLNSIEFPFKVYHFGKRLSFKA